MKKSLGLFAAAVLAACSSGTGSNGVQAPPSKTFTYGSGSAPSAQQQTAATDASTTTNQVVVAATGGSTASASSAPELATTITTEALPAAMAPSPTPRFSSTETMMSKAKANVRGGSLAANCYTETANSLTYNHCDCSGGTTGYTCSINGTLTASADNVTWNITITIDYSGSGSTVTEDGTLSGDITVTTTTTGGTINGFAKEEISATANGSGTSEYFAYTAEVDFRSLVFDNNCSGFFTSGELEARRTVATSGNYTAPYTNAGALFDWTACGSYTVAVSTN
jgi:hypothetical protein